MRSWKPCQQMEHIERIYADSRRQPTFLFKFSPHCPLSAYMWEVFQEFLKAHSVYPCWRVDVIQHREVSQEIARRTGIRHESPQVLLFYRDRVVWHGSHWEIDEEAIREALHSLSESP